MTAVTQMVPNRLEYFKMSTFLTLSYRWVELGAVRYHWDNFFAAHLPNRGFEYSLVDDTSEDTSFYTYARTQAERRILMRHRGRQPQYHYGKLGNENMIIGKRIMVGSEAPGLSIDVETEDCKHACTGGSQFFSRSRVTSGTKFGPNILMLRMRLSAVPKALVADIRRCRGAQ